jgi:hypothetical protein
MYHSKEDVSKDPRPAQPKKEEPPLDVGELVVLLTPPTAPASAPAVAPLPTAAPSADASAAIPVAAPASAPPNASVPAKTAEQDVKIVPPGHFTSPSVSPSLLLILIHSPLQHTAWDNKWVETAFKTAEKIAALARVEKARLQLTVNAGPAGDLLLSTLVQLLAVDGFAARSRPAALQGQV